jgi:hypothetical protein
MTLRDLNQMDVNPSLVSKLTVFIRTIVKNADDVEALISGNSSSPLDVVHHYQNDVAFC